MKNINDILEIILITYNRKEKLENTLHQLFAEDSPVKNLQFTILNNKSTDGSTELINEYAAKFDNIKLVIHSKNIGGNASLRNHDKIERKCNTFFQDFMNFVALRAGAHADKTPSQFPTFEITEKLVILLNKQQHKQNLF